MDTKYFQQALDEWRKKQKRYAITIGEVTVAEFSSILDRAQKLKDADSLEAQRRGRENALNRMGA